MIIEIKLKKKVHLVGPYYANVYADLYCHMLRLGAMHRPCVQNLSHQGYTNPRQLFIQVTKFCTAAPNIFVMIVAVSSCTYKNMCEFPCTKRKVSDD